MSEYSIQELARLTGVSTRTLRWYHQIGLLCPARIGKNGYRLYSSEEVDRLQQILFYRALGVKLAKIGDILDAPGFDQTAALRGHLEALRCERARIDALIQTVQRTIESKERNEHMMDEQKFDCFKRDTIRGLEEAYGREIRQKYGDSSMDQAKAAVMAMNQNAYTQWMQLGEEIRSRLTQAVCAHEQPNSPAGAEIAGLHKRWLMLGPCPYSEKYHAGLAQMYAADERFRRYYDRDAAGCAQFLCEAVLSWLNQAR